MSHYHPIRDTEYKSLLLHDENDFDPGDECSPRFDPGQRRGRQLTSGVAQMLQVWPALLSQMMWTFVLALFACLLFILAILSLVLTTNFSLSTDHTLHLHTRSVHTLPPVSLTQSRAHTESLYRYIVTGSDDDINMFYVIDQDRTLEPFARKLLKFYTRAGYKVFLVRVCHTRFADDDDEIEGVFNEKIHENRMVGKRDENGIDNEKGDSGIKKNDLVQNGINNKQSRIAEQRRLYKRAAKSKISRDSASQDSSILISDIKPDIQESRTGDSQSVNPDENVKLTAEGFNRDTGAQSTADIETYDANLRREIASDFGQSREFFDRLRNILSRNRTFEEDARDHATSERLPITSREINVTESNDELKKVQVCTCPGCGHVKSRGRKIFGSDSGDADLAKVELLNLNYREFLRGTLFEGHLAALDGNSFETEKSARENKLNLKSAGLIEKENHPKQVVGNINSVEISTGGDQYDLNLVKLLLLWKFGNSLVLLDDQATLLHSNLIDRGRVNLGFHLIYSPYECSSVIFNIMQEYGRHREKGLSAALGQVYRMFCKRAPRGFCNAITYVRVKRK